MKIIDNYSITRLFISKDINIYCDNHIVFILQSVDLVCHTDLFADIEESLYP